jgi:long-subunit acyl-CoA synthetase (AMP-forming)
MEARRHNTPINPTLTDVDVNQQLEESGARLLVAEDGATTSVGVATLAIGDLCKVIGWPDLPLPKDSSDLALLVYTGGPTGARHGVMIRSPRPGGRPVFRSSCARARACPTCRCTF